MILRSIAVNNLVFVEDCLFSPPIGGLRVDTYLEGELPASEVRLAEKALLALTSDPLCRNVSFLFGSVSNIMDLYECPSVIM